ncbi:MAG: flippase-like domain-containing protein [Alphaproteobacteria bacterium]|nr:flippase-like domain-containing protein [Alphaproteobacteria bacterium]
MKKLISLAVSLALIAVIWAVVDIRALAAALARTDPAMLGLAIAMVAPLVLVTGFRLSRLSPRGGRLGVGEAVRLTLAASVLNMVLPSKMGDLAKAWFIADRGGARGSMAVSLVVFEKALDMLALLAWCVLGLVMAGDGGVLARGGLVLVGGMLAAGLVLLGSRQVAVGLLGLAARLGPKRLSPKLITLGEAWSEMHRHFWRHPMPVFEAALISLGLWFLHLLQVWMFILALGGFVPLLDAVARAPLAILAGLMPLTFAGVGTRDAALIVVFAPWIDQAGGAALGILCTLRYLLPAMLGLPFLHHYMARLRGAAPP